MMHVCHYQWRTTKHDESNTEWEKEKGDTCNEKKRYENSAGTTICKWTMMSEKSNDNIATYAITTR